MDLSKPAGKIAPGEEDKIIRSIWPDVQVLTWKEVVTKHKSLFHTKMTPKRHIKNSYEKSRKNDFEKSSGLPASLDGSSQPKK